MEKILERKYGEAFLFSKKVGEKNAGVACVLEGMVSIGRYDDLGDTLAIIDAQKKLSSCKASGLWEALRVFELGYAQSELGHSVKGAWNTRSAAGVFENSPEVSPRAFYAIYAYYMDGAFSWLPFVSDDRPSHLKSLLDGALQSKWFWPLFTTSLSWMYYDRGEYDLAIELVDKALAKVPGHPVFLQIRADMLYRKGNFSEAAKIYEASASDYLNRSGKSIRYWCAVANLVRIYHDGKNEEASSTWKKELQSEEFKKIRKWMPHSLMDDLKKRDLLNSK